MTDPRGQQARRPSPNPRGGPAAGLRVARPTDPDPVRDPSVADLRVQIVTRLKRMSGLHARHAVGWDCDQDIGPHALVFFYAETLEYDGQVRYELRTAARWFLGGEDVDDLPIMLGQLAEIAGDILRIGDLDPRVQMVDPARVDRMTGEARYVGVGVTSLDTPQTLFRDIRDEVDRNPFAVPRRAFAHLVDGTLLMMNRTGDTRAARSSVSQVGVFTETILSNRSLDITLGRAGLVWTRLRPADHDHPPGIWSGLGMLHEAVQEGDRRRAERVSARHQHRGVGAPPPGR